MGTKQITYFFFGAGLFLLVWLSYAINQRLRERDMLHERVRQSYRLLDVIAELEGLLKDVEVAQYAWVQTSDTLYLKSYNSAVSALIKAQFKLSDNTLANSELHAYIEDVNTQLRHDLSGVFSHKDDTGRVVRPIHLVVHQNERAARAVSRIKDMVSYLKSTTIRPISHLEALLQQQAKHAGYQTNSIVGVLAAMLIYGFFILQWRRNQVQKLTQNLSLHNQELSEKAKVYRHSTSD